MGTKSYQIHPQLTTDSHELFEWQRCHLRLHKNARLPWLIIIPETRQIEFHDLSEDFQLHITRISQVASRYFKSQFGAEKINFAAIGNVVQQLHIHVIGRHSKDPLWPGVVWGNELPLKQYMADEITSITRFLLNNLEGVA